jgi:hypothetical protein
LVYRLFQRDRLANELQQCACDALISGGATQLKEDEAENVAERYEAYQSNYGQKAAGD